MARNCGPVVPWGRSLTFRPSAQVIVGTPGHKERAKPTQRARRLRAISPIRCHPGGNGDGIGLISQIVALGRLMERQLGYAEGHINPIALRLLIRAYWSRVSGFAHTIHDET